MNKSNLLKGIFTTLIILLSGPSLFAQPGANDSTFNTMDDGQHGTSSGFGSYVSAAKIQTDGKVIVAGGFTGFNGTTVNRIARLNNDGALDLSFITGSGFNAPPLQLYLQSDEKIIAVGQFTSYNGTGLAYIARLTNDGSLDATFDAGPGFDALTRTAIIQSDGKIIIGGDFTSYNGVSTSRLVRLNSDGSVDASFTIGAGFNGSVRCIQIQSDGKLVVVGSFSSYDGVAAYGIVRLNSDGSLDSSFNYGTGFNSVPKTIAIQTDGKIIIAGQFSNYNGTSCSCIIRLNGDGSHDVTFAPTSGFNSEVLSISLTSDGKIYAVGTFLTYNGTSRNYVARLNSDGTLDLSFNPNLGFNDYTFELAIQSDDKVIIAGQFTSFNSQIRNRIVRLNSDGSRDYEFNPRPGFDNSVLATSIQPDGKILAGGDFTLFNEVSTNRIVRLNQDGSIDLGFNTGTGFNASVRTIAVQSDGKILVGGDFTAYGGTVVNRIVRLNSDGSLDLGFISGSNFDGAVRSLCIQSDAKILVVGQFTTYNGVSRVRIVRLNSDGTIDFGFDTGSGFNNTVSTISIQSDGKIIVGGSYTSFNGTSRNNIARLNEDGTLDLTFNPGTGFLGGGGSFLLALGIQSDGKIIAGGHFLYFNGTPVNRIARINIDGSLDVSYNIGTGFNASVNSLSIQNDDKIIVGGAFTSFNGVSRNRITRLNSNGTIDASFDIGTGFSGTIETLSIQQDDKVVVGGSFLFNRGSRKHRIARLLTSCLPISSTVTVSACDTYLLNGTTYTASGIYQQNLLTASGCDSTLTLNLTVNYSNSTTTTVTACDSYTWIDGNTYTSSNNTASFTLTNVAGCDSVVTLNLTINHSTTGTDSQTACESFTWIDGITYTGSNNLATFTLENAAGCDSVVTLDLTIIHSSTGTDVQSGCGSFTWIDGNTYTSSNNTATFYLLNSVGCDSIITLDLTMSNTFGIDVQSACGSYVWIDGNIYTSSNNSATFTLTNADGCDSIITLDLTIFNQSTGIDVRTACDSYTWIDGNTYTSSNNTATFLLTNAAGCDSIVTLDLTILTASNGTDIQTACGSYTWIDGNTYTSSNNTATFTLTNTAGCDSLVTLDLTILAPSTGIDVQTACGSFTWIDGNSYTASTNTPTFTLSNAAGCDSVVTLNLMINTLSSGTDVQSACGSYTWIDGNIYTSSNNVATFTLTNAAGCDSVVTLNLTINTIPTANATDNGNGSISATGGGSYSWLNCTTNTLVPGATSAIFSPAQNGSYAAIVENAAGCEDTSACVLIDYIGIDENEQTGIITIYPNPNNGSFTITTTIGGNYILTNELGQLVQLIELNASNNFHVALNSLSSGVYFLKNEQNAGQPTTRITVIN